VLDGIRDEVLARFANAFPEGGTLVTVRKIVFALASFCRTLISGDSA
jgi:hypothetical protein